VNVLRLEGDIVIHTADLTARGAVLRRGPVPRVMPRPRVPTLLVARLRPNPPADLIGLRGDDAGKTRVYAVGGLTIALTVEVASSGRGQRWSLLGLLVDESTDEALSMQAVARLYDGATFYAQTPIDEWANLAFSDLEAGMYRLELVLDERVIAVEDIAIGIPPQ
jgi:hypothetical protein